MPCQYPAKFHVEGASPPIRAQVQTLTASLARSTGKMINGTAGTSLSLASHMATPVKTTGLQGLAMLKPLAGRPTNLSGEPCAALLHNLE